MKCNNYQNLEYKNYGRRKTIKGMLFGTIFGFLIAGGIGVAAVTLQAEQVKYTPSNSNFEAINAKEALDEIYKLAEYEVPTDTYFYDSNTNGENIVRYKKVDGKYYLCDENGKITSEEEQDISTLTLVEYTYLNSSTLNVGSAGFVNENLTLGDGSNLLTNAKTITFTKSFYFTEDGLQAPLSISKEEIGCKKILGLKSYDGQWKGISSDNFIRNLQVSENGDVLQVNFVNIHAGNSTTKVTVSIKLLVL